MKIEILDGKDCIGGNKILVRSQEGSLFLDFGKNFKTWGNYFEEYLQPRTAVGIFDIWKLGFVPRFNNIYREDLITSEFKENVTKQNFLEDLKAVFVSHCHLDHAGFISILKEDIPIVSSKITKKILLAMQDTGDGKAFSEFIKIKKKEEVEDEKGQKKLSGKTKNEPLERHFIETPEEAFEGVINGIKFKTFPVDHSVPGATSILLEIDGKKIAYTGDLRFHGKHGVNTQKFVEKISELKPDVLITEGTRVYSENRSKYNKNSVSEEDVYKASFDVISKLDGKLVIADFGARNIERLETFLNISKDTKRNFVITMKDAYLLDALKDVGFNYIEDENIIILLDKKAASKKWMNEIKEKYNNKLVTISDVEKSLGDFMLSFSFWDFTNLLDIKIDGGAYIYSTSEAFTEEQIIDIKRLMNWIKFYNFKPYGIYLDKNDNPQFTKEFHASGHASCEDLFNAIEKISPKYLIPVHTEHIEIFIERFKYRGIKVITENTFEL